MCALKRNKLPRVNDFVPKLYSRRLPDAFISLVCAKLWNSRAILNIRPTSFGVTNYLNKEQAKPQKWITMSSSANWQLGNFQNLSIWLFDVVLRFYFVKNDFSVDNSQVSAIMISFFFLSSGINTKTCLGEQRFEDKLFIFEEVEFLRKWPCRRIYAFYMKLRFPSFAYPFCFFYFFCFKIQ